jgi:PhnB protein
MKVQPYINFDGRCEEALEFYKSAIGAQVQMVMRFKEAPAEEDVPAPDPAMADKVMHAAFSIGETIVMASDGGCQNGAQFSGISLSIEVDEPEEARKLFDALGEGGEPAMPFGPTFFAKGFGVVNDRFGVTWMVIAPAEMG